MMNYKAILMNYKTILCVLKDSTSGLALRQFTQQRG